MADVKQYLQENLSLIRACAGWTAQDLADKLDVRRQTVGSFEKKGKELNMMQYLALRQVIETEIREHKDSNEMLALVMDALVDNRENYTQEAREEIANKARLMAPAIMKSPGEKKTISAAWVALMAASGIVASAALMEVFKKHDG